jgi:hypothetical protein
MKVEGQFHIVNGVPRKYIKVGGSAEPSVFMHFARTAADPFMPVQRRIHRIIHCVSAH